MYYPPGSLFPGTIYLATVQLFQEFEDNSVAQNKQYLKKVLFVRNTFIIFAP